MTRESASIPAVGSTLLLFTETYPWDFAQEETFIEPQIPYLREAFERVIVVPLRSKGRRLEVSGAEVEVGLAQSWGLRAGRLSLFARAVASQLFWDELREQRRILRSAAAVRRLLALAGRAAVTRAWVKRFVAESEINPRDCVAYTFWCDQTTTALALYKGEAPDLIVVSRANGIDLIAERHDPPYLPCRAFTLGRLDRLFPVSEFGKQYEDERYPWFASRCEVARLGVGDPGFVSEASAPGRCVLLSCSGVVPVKRVDLIAKSIDVAARRLPTTQFDWHHFGDGDLLAAIEDSTAGWPSNATARLHGHRSIDEIMQFYRDEPVDVFINASSSEGGVPVAIMEAASCGIPIIATDVGGNPEIVSDMNGWLVSADPSPEEMADAMMAMINQPEASAVKRVRSREVWDREFQAKSNYTSFARRLAELRSSNP